jgi:hypothetical protein
VADPDDILGSLQLPGQRLLDTGPSFDSLVLTVLEDSVSNASLTAMDSETAPDTGISVLMTEMNVRARRDYLIPFTCNARADYGIDPPFSVDVRIDFDPSSLPEKKASAPGALALYSSRSRRVWRMHPPPPNRSSRGLPRPSSTARIPRNVFLVEGRAPHVGSSSRT